MTKDQIMELRCEKNGVPCLVQRVIYRSVDHRVTLTLLDGRYVHTEPELLCQSCSLFGPTAMQLLEMYQNAEQMAEREWANIKPHSEATSQRTAAIH